MQTKTGTFENLNEYATLTTSTYTGQPQKLACILYCHLAIAYEKSPQSFIENTSSSSVKEGKSLLGIFLESYRLNFYSVVELYFAVT